MTASLTSDEIVDEPYSYAEGIDQNAEQLRDELHDSVLGHNEALAELFDVYFDGREPGWDGFNAEPVSHGSFIAAYNLIRSLPLGFSRPSVGAEPDGQITLEWYRNPSRILSVSVDPRGILHFAGLFGPDRQSGRIAFFADEVPDELIHLVRKV